jgi:hypothetical protein
MARNRDRRRRSLACVAPDGIIVMLFGILIWKQWPSGSFWVIAALPGVCMVIEGLTRAAGPLSYKQTKSSEVLPCRNVEWHRKRFHQTITSDLAEQ